MKLTVAQALVKFLDSQYIEIDGEVTKFVEGVFTIFGHGNVLGLGEALENEEHSLKVYQGRNEQGMAHIAMGFAKQSKRKKIYACSSSVGPGAANMVTAAATATANRIPVLFLPGDVYACRQPDPVLQQIEQTHDLSISTNDAFKAVSKYWDRVSRPEQLMSAMINAIRVLINPAETGAVTIALPQDVQGESYDFPDYFLKKRIHRIERRTPTCDEISDALKILTKAKKPILICGGGVKYSQCEKEFLSFSEKFNIPFGETQAGKGAIDSGHKLNLGGIGTTGNLSANRIATNADVVIGVGTRYTDFTTASKWLFQNPDVKFININVSEFDSYKFDAVKIVADGKVTLEELSKRLNELSYKSSYTTEIESIKKEWEKELERVNSLEYGENFVPEIAGHLDNCMEEYGEINNSYLTQTRVLGILNSLIKKNSIIVGAAGSLPGDLQRVWKTTGDNSYHMEYGYSCMGYEIAAALGAKIAEPSKEVYAMIGDGSYLMLHTELVTALQENKKINIILLDNIGFGCINNLQMENGMGSFGTEFRKRNIESGKLDGSLIKIDFAKCAEGYGCKTYSIRTKEELVKAFEDSKEYEEVVLFDIKVLPKTMTKGYEAWWRVGNAEISKNKNIENATRQLKIEIEKARKY